MPDRNAPIPPRSAQTPSQTVGPFFGYALPYPGGADVAPGWHPDAMRLHGTVFDGNGDPVPDAILEIWHADPHGLPIRVRGSLARDSYTVTGFGRAAVDGSGHYSFTTLKPGAMRAGSAPYVLIAVFARGLMHHLFTRAYFADEVAGNASDPALDRVPADRRETLMAAADAPGSYRFDIRLQGDGETVFFDFGIDDV